MSIYHLSVKTISRSDGRSATAAASYRAAAVIHDDITGITHDYSRKSGVESSTIFLPDNAPAWASDRAQLWNAVEKAETRKNSCVAREFEVALPSELSPVERQRLAHDFTREIVAKHSCAADVSIHAPGADGDSKNFHAHILLSTRRLTPNGFGEKTRELDEKKSGEVDYWRERFATMQNEALARNGIESRVDHRTLKAQGIDRTPTVHLGPEATAFERRTGEKSDIRLRHEEISARLAAAAGVGKLLRDVADLDASIISLSTDLREAIEQRDREARLVQPAPPPPKPDTYTIRDMVRLLDSRITDERVRYNAALKSAQSAHARAIAIPVTKTEALYQICPGIENAHRAHIEAQVRLKAAQAKLDATKKFLGFNTAERKAALLDVAQKTALLEKTKAALADASKTHYKPEHSVEADALVSSRDKAIYDATAALNRLREPDTVAIDEKKSVEPIIDRMRNQTFDKKMVDERGPAAVLIERNRQLNATAEPDRVRSAAEIELRRAQLQLEAEQRREEELRRRESTHDRGMSR